MVAMTPCPNCGVKLKIDIGTSRSRRSDRGVRAAAQHGRIEPYAGDVQLSLSFDQVYQRLRDCGTVSSTTAAGTPFEAAAKTARDGRRFIRFTRDGKDRARAYPDRWEHYYNEHRTRIGMYCVALVEAVK